MKIAFTSQLNWITLLCFVHFLEFYYADIMPKMKVTFPSFITVKNNIAEIQEGKKNGSFIGFIEIEGSDSSWILLCSSKDFILQHTYGTTWSLNTAVDLDRERTEFYNLTIKTNNLLNDYETAVYIRVLDINDNTPVFSKKTYVCAIAAGLSKGTFVLRVHADDNDTEKNGEITYKLDNYVDLFKINHLSGAIYLKKPLVKSSRYDLIVRAQDQGNPSLSSTTVVQIKVNEEGWSLLKIQMLPVTIGVGSGILMIILIISVVIATKKRKNLNEVNSSSTLMKKERQNSSSQNSFVYDTNKCNYQIAALSCMNSTPSSDDYYNNFCTKTLMNASPAPIDTDSFYGNKNECAHSSRNDNLRNIQPSMQSPSNNYSSYYRPDVALELEESKKPEKLLSVRKNKLTNSDDGCYCSSDMSSENSEKLNKAAKCNLYTVKETASYSKQFPTASTGNYASDTAGVQKHVKWDACSPSSTVRKFDNNHNVLEIDIKESSASYV